MSLPDEQLTIDLYKPSEVQQEAHSCRTGNFTEILYGGTAGCGKRLSIDTPIPTPTGWATMGELQVGDEVLSDCGMPCRVTAATPIQEAPRSFAVKFSDGSIIEADGEHLWRTVSYSEREKRSHRTEEFRAARREKRARRSKGKRPDLARMNAARSYEYLAPHEGTVRTTDEIRASLYFRDRLNHSIPNAEPLHLHLEDAIEYADALPLDPYTLGAWLGDGHGNTGMVTGVDQGVFAEICKAGFNVYQPPAAKDEWRAEGLTAVLKSMGLLADHKSANKHIPPEYLRAPLADRLSLLQGLMDTDGCCCAESGRCEFTTTKPRLRDDVYELLVSLGIKVTANEGVAKLHGRVIGAKWRLAFYSKLPAFRLERKLCRQKRDQFRGDIAFQRYIVAVDPIPPRMMRCISVDSPSRMYLAGRSMIPTHNSLWLWWDPILMQVFGEHERYIQQLRLGNKNWRSSGWWLHLRRTYKMLTETMDALGYIIPQVDPGAHWNGDKNLWTFSCGYHYEFGHLERESDWRIYDSRNLSGAAHDEVIQELRPQYMGIYQRIRSGDPVLSKNLRLISASNPDCPPDGVWVKERFVDPAPGGRKVLVEKRKLFDGTISERGRVFIPASLSDNPSEDVRREYEITLRQQPHHVMLARLMGDWNVIEGAFFAWEWRPDRHVVKPFDIPKHWPRGRSIDWGYKNACPVYHFAQNPDGDLIFYRETTYNYKLKDEKYRKDAELVALSIRKEEISYGEWDEERNISLLSGPSDPEMEADHGGGGPSIRQTMENHGVYWQKQAKDTEQAVAELLRRLRDVPSDPKKMPGIVFFDTCTEIIRTLPTIPTDKNNPEMPEHGGPHHWLDAVLCACLYCPTSSLQEEKPRPKNHPDFDADEDDLTKARRHKRSLGGFRQFAR